MSSLIMVDSSHGGDRLVPAPRGPRRQGRQENRLEGPCVSWRSWLLGDLGARRARSGAERCGLTLAQSHDHGSSRSSTSPCGSKAFFFVAVAEADAPSVDVTGAADGTAPTANAITSSTE